MIEQLALCVAGLWVGAASVLLARKVRAHLTGPRRRKTDVPSGRSSRHPAARHSITVTGRERLGTYTIPRPRSGADN